MLAYLHYELETDAEMQILVQKIAKLRQDQAPEGGVTPQVFSRRPLPHGVGAYEYATGGHINADK